MNPINVESNSVDGWKDRFESSTGENEAFALRVMGDLGLPAVRDGEYIVIEPTMKPSPTDRVVIVLADGRTLLQELIIEREDSITVSSLDGTTRRTIQREDIRPEFGIQMVTAILSAKKWSES